MADTLSDSKAGADAKPMAVDGSNAAAILLMLLDDEEAAQVLAQLGPPEVQQLGTAMFNVADVKEEQIEDVLSLFLARARDRTTLGFAAVPRIRSVMQRAFGQDRADTMMARITPPARSNALDVLRWMDARTIAGLICHEHHQIIALVLAQLDAPIAADVLQLLPEPLQIEAIGRIARLENVTTEALDELEQVLQHQLALVSSAPAAARGGLSEAAKIMNNTRPGHDQHIIALLKAQHPELAQGIQDEMFVFDDLAALDPKNMGVLLRNIDNEVLVIALKGATDSLREKMLSCLSSRAADTIRDDMAERGSVRLAEVLGAQKSMVETARTMGDEGTLVFAGKGDDYV
ncbi:MAG: flagellar motor switch protein FliG [Sphingopyxis sp.]